jgi:hypothetical protein
LTVVRGRKVMRGCLCRGLGIDGWIDDEQRLGRRCSDPSALECQGYVIDSRPKRPEVYAVTYRADSLEEAVDNDREIAAERGPD